jgi:hypothetical protein
VGAGGWGVVHRLGVVILVLVLLVVLVVIVVLQLVQHLCGNCSRSGILSVS